MSRPTYNIRNQVIDLTTRNITPVVDNLYKESLRAMLHLMGDLYYIDGNNNKVKVKCITGNPERLASRLVADNTMQLPLISVTEVSTSNSDERRRHNHVLISEKEWDPKSRRAIRIVSLAPRPINITYEVNIWTKYKSDMDMLRSSIYMLFNPDLVVRTKFSDYNRAFLLEERDLGSLTANDAEDRVIQKVITISLETYIPSPKFRITSTGQISDFISEFVIDKGTSKEATELVAILGDAEDRSITYVEPPALKYLDLGVLNLSLSESISVSIRDSFVDLGILDLSTSIQNLFTSHSLSLQENNLVLSALELEYSEYIAPTEGSVNLGIASLVTSALNINLDNGVSLGTIEVDNNTDSIKLDHRSNLETATLITSIDDIKLNYETVLEDINIVLSSLDFSYVLTAPPLENQDIDLGFVNMSLASPYLLLNQNYSASTIEVGFSLPDLVYGVGLTTEDPNILLSVESKYDIGLDFGIYNTDAPDPDF